MKKYFVLKLTNKLFSLQGRNAATYFFARISGLLVQILTVPLLAKSLGVKGVGTIAYAQAIVVFLGGFVDFGFNVTATRLIALAKNNNRALRELFWTIQASRAILLVVALIILFIVAEFFTSSDSEKYVVMLGSLAIIGMYLTPQWFFQGLEKIPSYVIATIIPRGVALVMIYTQVKDHNDLIVAAALMFLGEASIGGGLSLLVTLKYLPGTPIFSMSVFKSQIGLALDGWLANIGFSVVAILNSIFVKNLLGLHAFGLYSSVEKIVRTSHSLVWPLAQSYYPLMCSHVKLKSKSYAFREALKYSIALGGGGLPVFLF